MTINSVLRQISILSILLVISLIAGCNNKTETASSAERWKTVAEVNESKYLLDTQSIVKAQMEKAAASTVSTIKRDIVSCWIRVEPVQGKEEDFKKKYGKDIAYGMFFSRYDKLNREFMPIEEVFYKSDGSVARENKPLPSFNPYQPGSLAEKITNLL